LTFYWTLNPLINSHLSSFIFGV